VVVEVAAPPAPPVEPAPDVADECRALVGIINRGVDGVQDVGTKGSAVEDLQALAAEMDRVVEELRDLELKSAELGRHAETYRAMASEVSAAARDLAAAVDEGDLGPMSEAERRVETAVAKEDPLVDGINAFCQQGRSGVPTAVVPRPSEMVARPHAHDVEAPSMARSPRRRGCR
jgi:hypothetical protein